VRLRAISCVSSRSRFFANAVAPYAGSPMPDATNQRNRML
jgi:hypothetical protein